MQHEQAAFHSWVSSLLQKGSIVCKEPQEKAKGKKQPIG